MNIAAIFRCARARAPIPGAMHGSTAQRSRKVDSMMDEIDAHVARSRALRAQVVSRRERALLEHGKEMELTATVLRQFPPTVDEWMARMGKLKEKQRSRWAPGRVRARREPAKRGLTRARLAGASCSQVCPACTSPPACLPPWATSGPGWAA